MSCGIYKITNLINNKSYIGQSSQIEKRWKKHCQSKDDFVIHKALQKYGPENFSFEILEETSLTALDEREIYWISYYNSMIPNGYNMIPGGSNGAGYAKGKEVQQFSLYGELLATYPSAHQADEMTGINYSNICSCCRHEQISAGGYQWRYSDDTNLNLITDETIFTKRSGVIQYDLEGNKIREYASLKEAHELTGIAKATICRVCKGKGQTAGGFRWGYVNEPLVEVKKKSKPALRKKIGQYNKNNILIKEYQSISEASSETGINLSNIGQVASGKRKTAGGYIWKYL